MKCTKCGFDNCENAIYCEECGYRLDGKITCPSCNFLNESDSTFCVNCGYKLKEKAPIETPIVIKKQKEKTKSISSKKNLLIIIGIIIGFLGGLFGTLTATIFVPKMNYENAMSIVDTDVDKAIELLDGCSWDDSKNQFAFAKARKCFTLGDYETGIEYMYNADGEVKVIYDSMGGNFIPSEKISKGLFINKKPNKEGYDFEGWKLSNFNFEENNYYVSINLYAQWSMKNYTVTVSSDNQKAGSVKIIDNDSLVASYPYKSNVKIEATTLDKGYTFDGWYNGTERVSTSTTFEFKIGVKDVHYVAKWVANKYRLIVESSNTNQGTVSGSGEYAYDSSVTITAKEKDGCHFIGWYFGDELLSTDLSYTFIMPSRLIVYTAKFSGDEYTVTLVSNNNNAGTIGGGGTYEVGESVAIGAIANTGYQFMGWYDGTKLLSSSSIYKFTMETKNLKYTAHFESTDFSFKYNSDRSGYILTGLNNKNLTDITIPTTFNRLSVVGIDTNAFWGCDKIKSVTMGAKILTIGSSAFRNCTSLESVTLSNAMTKISNYTFSNCTSLKNFKISKYSKINTIGDYAFKNCSSLEKLFIPKTISKIGYGAFDGCSSLILYCETNEKPSGWNDEWNYSEVTVVWGCDAIPENDNNVNGFKYAVGSYEGEAAIFIVGYEAGVTDIVIPSSIDDITNIVIANSAFKECDTLRTITLSDNVNSIGGYAFANCTSLSSITIGENSMLSSIGNHAFDNCSILESIYLPKNLECIGEYSFNCCTSLTDIMIVENSKLDCIETCAFSYCTSLESIYLPKTISNLGYAVFSNSYPLVIYCESESVPTNWNPNWGLGIAVVWGVKDKTSFTLDGFKYSIGTFNGEKIMYVTGYEQGVTDIVIPSTIENVNKVVICGHAFYNCDTLESFIFYDNVISIEKGSFDGCESLESIYLPNTLTFLAGYSFKDCPSLTIYVEDRSSQSGWESTWSYHHTSNIVWGVTREQYNNLTTK